LVGAGGGEDLFQHVDTELLWAILGRLVCQSINAVNRAVLSKENMFRDPERGPGRLYQGDSGDKLSKESSGIPSRLLVGRVLQVESSKRWEREVENACFQSVK
jgi:hypothetical protein